MNILRKIKSNGWLRSWQLWVVAALLAATIWIWFPVKFGSILLLLTRFFALAGAAYVCGRVFFPKRFHEEDIAELQFARTIGWYVLLAGCAIGAGAGAIG